MTATNPIGLSLWPISYPILSEGDVIEKGSSEAHPTSCIKSLVDLRQAYLDCKTAPWSSPQDNTIYSFFPTDAVRYTTLATVYDLSTEQVFRVKKFVGLPPQLELLADSVTSQVHDNLSKLGHTESISMHRASLMQGHTDTNRLCKYFLSFLCSIGTAPNNPAIHT